MRLSWETTAAGAPSLGDSSNSADAAAVGLPPMKRLKQIRLSLARGLVHYSDLNMTEIALRVGYGRVHEFSRDYRLAHGRPPTADRAAAPGLR